MKVATALAAGLGKRTVGRLTLGWSGRIDRRRLENRSGRICYRNKQ